MAKISFKMDSVTNRTTLRISKNYYPYRFIQYLKEKDDFKFCATNKMNHVFVYNGTVENAEFYFNAHVVTYKNLQNKLNLGGI